MDVRLNDPRVERAVAAAVLFPAGDHVRAELLGRFAVGALLSVGAAGNSVRLTMSDPDHPGDEPRVFEVVVREVRNP